MNGAHDLGGMMGFGPIAPEKDEPAFHAPWEGRVLAMEIATRNAGVPWNLDMIRSIRESLPPPEYLTMSYYEIWLHSQTELLTRYGFVAAEELDVGHALEGPLHTGRVLHAGNVMSAVTKPGSYIREVAEPARFAVGDTVRTLNINPTGHTRLPRYARAKTGTIGRIHRDGRVDLKLVNGTPICLAADYVAAGHVDYGYATTIHKAQGITCDRMFLVGPAGLYREALTRISPGASG